MHQGKNTALKFTSVLMIFTSFLWGCSDEELNVVATQNQDIKFIAQESDTIIKSNYSGIKEKNYRLINDLATFEDLWQRHTSFEKPPSSIPKVDFTTQSVVAAFMGEHPTAGYAITINEVNSSSTASVTGAITHIATITLQNPAGRDCVYTQALTQPAHMIMLPKIEGTLAVRENEVIKNCDVVIQPPVPTKPNFVVELTTDSSEMKMPLYALINDNDPSDGIGLEKIWTLHSNIPTSKDSPLYSKTIVAMFLGTQRCGTTPTVSQVSETETGLSINLQILVDESKICIRAPEPVIFISVSDTAAGKTLSINTKLLRQ